MCAGMCWADAVSAQALVPGLQVPGQVVEHADLGTCVDDPRFSRGTGDEVRPLERGRPVVHGEQHGGCLRKTAPSAMVLLNSPDRAAQTLPLAPAAGTSLVGRTLTAQITYGIVNQHVEDLHRGAEMEPVTADRVHAGRGSVRWHGNVADRWP